MNQQLRKPDPEETVSLFLLLVRQYGLGLLFAGVFAFAVERVYDDLRKQTDLLVSLVREQSAASREVADALRDLVQEVGNQERK
jgi:hypothetical protein